MCSRMRRIPDARRTLSDPYGVEEGGEMKGLDLLPIDTVFEKAKTRTQVSGQLKPLGGILSDLSGRSFEGYEIHMGISKPCGAVEGFADITTVSGQALRKADGNHCGDVYGTYIHGIFDQEEIAKGVAIALAKAKGLNYDDMNALDMKQYKEQQYDQLAETVRANLNMETVYDIIEKRK